MINPKIFKPGTPAAIEVHDYVKTKFSTFFRGYKNKNFIMADHPRRDGLLLPIQDETKCIVRFIHEGEIIGFNSRIAVTVPRPFPLMFITFPETVETSRLRKYLRFPVSIPVFLTRRNFPGEDESPPQSLALNLSHGGCLVESRQAFNVGENILMTLMLPEMGRVENVEVEVRRCDKKGEFNLVGLQFYDFLDDGYQEVKAYLNLLEALRVRA
ncbi:MAG: flagellar brake protein [Pseudomonadota bacterium]